MSLAPPFSPPFLHPNGQDRVIGTFAASTTCASHAAGLAKLEVGLRPYPRLAVDATGPLISPVVQDEFADLQIFEAVNTVFGQHGTINAFDSSGSRHEWYMRGFMGQPANETTSIGYLIGHLYNFDQDLPGAPTSSYPDQHGVGHRSTWRFGKWILTIDCLLDQKRFEDAAKRDVHVLTHVLHVERTNPKQKTLPPLFSGADADKVCAFLESALGLIAGAPVGPSLTAGRRQDDPFVWLWPGAPLRTARSKRQNWALNDQHTGCMSLLQPMWDAWQSPTKRDWIERAIPIYLEASRVDLPWDIRIAVAQTGLEMMASLILTESDRVLSLKAYESLHTAAQLRALLEHLNIDPQLPSWTACRPRQSKGDLADALIDLRNAIIHPTAANRQWLKQQDSRAFLESWELLLEFLELAMLYAIGYSGKYVSCQDGKIHALPWTMPRTVAKSTVSAVRARASARGGRAALSMLASFGTGLLLGWFGGRFGQQLSDD